ncbi:MAG: methionine--tRNA ligase [Acholeplasmataceae bacterium]|jgi:methionyl-tRNA synthetase|nr:methionine--tRNA ligase [Acholeplasmataceae bacterium]MCK9234061.1 methionine--tRNA ligase [Acholeplasmataceae bacterium]MCK9288835.1 methionine--tRNA ligase [Acholeplasmataceae bacterium]MCK9427259.1 methionine--tRNA ligase [Acholeplasmataceae bacterium]HHT39160.1 methionine--tRNA ligase [Acholeplasmataceae bacterium]
MKEKFYLTTAITYTTGIPHIGNVYEAVLADAIARFKRLDGYDVLFQTGTDEHGQKIADRAMSLNKSPQEHVDYISDEIKRIYHSLDISYDRFVRTTDENHQKLVQLIFKKLYQQGDIYLGKYSGWYSVSEEAFIFDKELIESGVGERGDKLVWMEEETYFFKLSKYQERLLAHLKKHPEFIQPESRKNEMLNNFLNEPLNDLSVTRTTLKWGIPTFDKTHVIYVWIDALANYITSLGLDENLTSAEFLKYWPADLHLIGKDILRFHTIYWPILLMALEMPLPKTIFGHPWILIDKLKMSKSIGNTIYVDDLLKHFDKDAIRYYVLHEIPYNSDGNLTYELLIERNNSDLANTLGNLVNRTLGMINKYNGGLVRKAFTKNDYQIDLKIIATSLLEKVRKKMNTYHVGDALEEIMKVTRAANKFIDLSEPWNLMKANNKDELDGVLYQLIETIRIIATLLKAFMPTTAEKIFQQLNIEPSNFEETLTFGLYPDSHRPNKPFVLFERFDKEKKMKEILEAKIDI